MGFLAIIASTATWIRTRQVSCQTSVPSSRRSGSSSRTSNVHREQSLMTSSRVFRHPCLVGGLGQPRLDHLLSDLSRADRPRAASRNVDSPSDPCTVGSDDTSRSRLQATVSAYFTSVQSEYCVAKGRLGVFAVFVRSDELDVTRETRN
jgi:hypothetical protein